MLAAMELLKALSEDEKIINSPPSHEEHDFEKVLDLYGESTYPEYNVMCSDGKIRNIWMTV